MSSIRDVAKYAHVAPSTVSLVLNNNGYVAENTRKRVQEAMRELNYVPNELARNLYHNKSRLIGIIVPDVAHPFYGSFIKYAEIAFSRMKYKTMVCSTQQKENSEIEYVDMLKRQMMDGIITGVHSLSLEHYAGVKRPILSLDRYINDEIPIVHVNHQKGGELAAQVLYESGCRHIVHICGSQVVNTPANNYHQAFEAYLQACGASVQRVEMGWNRFSVADFQKAAAEVFDGYPETDGILAPDIGACICLQEAQRRGIAVPQALQLVAYDGTYVTQLASLPITAVVQPLEQLAETAARELVQLIEGKTVEPHEIVLDVTLRQGQTTRRLNAFA